MNPTRPLLVTAGLFAITAAVFAPATGYGFVAYDDDVYVESNPHVRNGLTVEGVVWAFTYFHAGYWLPATWVSFQLDATVWGDTPAGYHRTNVLLHAANAAFVFLLLRKLTGAAGRSAAVALLFALHPLRVESVAWVTERKDVLGGFFWLVAIMVYAKGGGPNPRRMVWAAVLFAAGLAAKPIVVTLPCVLLLLDFWPLGRLKRFADLPALLREKAVLFAVAAAASAVTAYAQNEGGGNPDLAALPLSARVSTALVGYAAYLRLTFRPVGLSALYPLPASWPAGEVAASAAVLLAVTLAAGVLWRRAPYLLVGWLWFLGVTFPVGGVMQSGEQAYADRFTYLPHVGLLLAVVWGLADAAAAARIPVPVRIAVVVVLAVGCGLLSRRQLESWRDTRALWEHAVAVDPGNAPAWHRLGKVHFLRHDWAEAVRCLDEACRLAPDRPQYDEARRRAATYLHQHPRPGDEE